MIKTLLTLALRKKEVTPPPGAVVEWDSAGRTLPARYLGRVGDGVLIEVRMPHADVSRRIVPEYQLSRGGVPLGKALGGTPRGLLRRKG